jgi:hypothetical protein
MIEESETPEIEPSPPHQGSRPDPPAEGAGDVLAERRARRAGDPAVMRRAEAAEAAVRNLETHLAALEQRLEEVGRERERIAQQLAERETDVRSVKQREYTEQQLRVEAEERGERVQRELRAEIQELHLRLSDTERQMREVNAELAQLRERDARLAPIVRELMEVVANLRAGFDRELNALREELQQQVTWERETYVRELTEMGARMEDLRFELARTAADLREQLSAEPLEGGLLQPTTEPASEREATHRRDMADALVAAVERLRARVAEVKEAEAQEEATEAPAEPPVAEPPTAEEPVAEPPTPEAPVAESPVAEEPVAGEPTAEGSAVDQPTAEPPVAEEPVAEPPVAEELVAEQLVAGEPAAEQPVAEPPVIERPVVDEPPVEQSVPGAPDGEGSPAESPAVDESPAEQPAPEVFAPEAPAAEAPAEPPVTVPEPPPAPESAPAVEPPVAEEDQGTAGLAAPIAAAERLAPPDQGSLIPGLGPSAKVGTKAVTSEPIALQSRLLAVPAKRISWLAPAIRRLAAKRDAKLAAELVIELIPAQRRFVKDPLSYEIKIGELGTFYVTLDPNQATISREPRGAVDFSLEGPVAAFSELAGGGVSRRRPGLRVRKGRRRARHFFKVRRQPLALADLAEAGVDVWPGLLLLAMAEAIDPPWTTGRRFELAFEINDTAGIVIYVRVRDGEPILVSRTPSGQPVATISLSGHALICLLAGTQPPAEHTTLVKGDVTSVDMFLQWTARAQGLSVAGA